MQTDADLTPLSQQAVQGLRLRAARRFKKQLEQALPEGASDELKRAMRFALARMNHHRRKLTTAQLKELAEKTPDELRRMGRRHEPAFSLKETRGLLNWSVKDVYRSLADHVFAPGQHRVYLPVLKGEKSELEQKVEAYLAEQGFSQTDYAAGTTVDDRNQTRRIGRVLRASGADSLARAFADDNSRNADRQMVVLSRHPYDVARMSTGRGWQSCMTKNGMYWRFMQQEIKLGTLVAYLVSENDPNINNPMSRIALKPYRNKAGETVWEAGHPYGFRSDNFRATVKQFAAETLNADRVGIFDMDQVYSDGMNKRVLKMPPDCSDMAPEAFFDALRIKYDKDEGTGQLTVGTLNLQKLGLTHLPDLTQIKITGDLRVGGNPLTSLKGCPQVLGGSLWAEDCGLTSLQYGPREVGDNYLVGYNPLGTLEHIAQKVGRNVDLRRCQLTSLKGLTREIGYSLHLTGNPDLTRLTDLPLVIEGDLELSATGLRDFEGAPMEVRGSLHASQCEHLESLAGSPSVVGREFKVTRSPLTSLKGGPQRVYGSYKVSQNQLTDCEGMADWVGGSIHLSYNPLNTLKGTPRVVCRNLHIGHTGLTSLKHGPEVINGSLYVAGLNGLRNLKDGPTRLRRGVETGYWDKRGAIGSLSLGLSSFKRRVASTGTNWTRLWEQHKDQLPPLRPHPRAAEKTAVPASETAKPAAL